MFEDRLAVCSLIVANFVRELREASAHWGTRVPYFIFLRAAPLSYRAPRDGRLYPR